MHRRIVVTLAVVALTVGAFSGCKKQEQQKTEQAPSTQQAPATAPSTPAAQSPTAGGATGEALFKQHCAACHPDGGNPMNPKKTLKTADMTANNVKSADDIVKLMRKPGQGMTKFDQSTISDDDAKKIADYILATFH